MVDAFAYFQAIYLSYHFIHRAEAQFGHDLAQFLYNETEEVHHVIGITGKAFAQFGILSSYTYGTGIQMTFTHHDTTFHHEGSGSHTPFFSTQQGGNSNIATCFHLSVGLYHYAAT